ASGEVAADGAVRHGQLSKGAVHIDASASAGSRIIANRAVDHRNRSTKGGDAAAVAAAEAPYAGYRVTTESTSHDRQRCFVAADAGGSEGGGRVANNAVAECESSGIIDGTARAAVGVMAVCDGKTGDCDVRCGIIKHDGSSVAVDRQIFRAGAFDGHVVVNL